MAQVNLQSYVTRLKILGELYPPSSNRVSFFNILFLSLHVCVCLYVSVFLSVTCVHVPVRWRKECQTLEAGVTGSCEPPDMVLRTKS